MIIPLWSNHIATIVGYHNYSLLILFDKIEKFVCLFAGAAHCRTFYKMISDNYFHLCVTGQISAAYFPIGMDSKQIFCRYDVVMGKDWEIVSGNHELQKNK